MPGGDAVGEGEAVGVGVGDAPGEGDGAGVGGVIGPGVSWSLGWRTVPTYTARWQTGLTRFVPEICTHTPLGPAGGPEYTPDPGDVSVLIAEIVGVWHTVGAGVAAAPACDEAPGAVCPAASRGNSGVSASPTTAVHASPVASRAHRLGTRAVGVLIVSAGE